MLISRRGFIGFSSVLLFTIMTSRKGEALNLVCPECKAVNLLTNRGCFNCGKGLIKSRRCTFCAEKYNCFQIPFPNPVYLIDTDKPFLNMKDIRF
jgi:hypothetical protein